MMKHSPSRVPVLAVVVLIATVAVSGAAAGGGGVGLVRSPACTAATQASRCVFRPPFDEDKALNFAYYGIANNLRITNFEVVRSASSCLPRRSTVDRLGRRGWHEFKCEVKIVGLAWTPDCTKDTDSYPCTGTIWQLPARGVPGYESDTHVKQAWLSVRIVMGIENCFIVYRVRQLAPFEPRIRMP